MNTIKILALAAVPMLTISNISFTVSTSTCPVVSNLLAQGGANDSVQVKSLQKFLKNVERADVEESGVFDAKTEKAVAAFQVKYAADILAPWSATIPSGVVNITTAKKINSIACGESMTLNDKQAGFIEAYIVKRDAPKNEVALVQDSNSGQGNIDARDVGSKNTGSKNGVGDDIDNTAGAANASSVIKAPMIERFWYFIKHLF